MAAKILGRYIISDTAICHGADLQGKPHSVKDVLEQEQVESGMVWEARKNGVEK